MYPNLFKVKGRGGTRQYKGILSPDKKGLRVTLDNTTVLSGSAEAPKDIICAVLAAQTNCRFRVTYSAGLAYIQGIRKDCVYPVRPALVVSAENAWGMARMIDSELDRQIDGVVTSLSLQQLNP